MGAKGSDKSGPKVVQSLLLATDYFFGAALSCLGGLVVFVFYASLQLCGGLFEGGVVVHRSRCLFLIVKRGIVETFAAFIGLRALHSFVYSSIHISSLHLFIYVFFILHLFVWFFGEVYSTYLSTCSFLFVGCLEGIFGLKSTSWASYQFWRFGVNLKFIDENLKFIKEAS